MNYCNYTMMVEGKKENVRELVKSFDYKSDTYNFYKVFNHMTLEEFEDEVELHSDNDDIVIEFNGHCSNSVKYAMFNSEYTSILDMARKLKLDIEIISEELGVNFTEHILIRNDEIEFDTREDFLTTEEMRQYILENNLEVYEKRCIEVYKFILEDSVRLEV